MSNKFYHAHLWALLVFIPAFVEAQNYGRVFHAYAGYDFISTTTVNNWMPVSLAYPELKNQFLSLGIDGCIIRNDFLIGGQFQIKHGPVVSGTGGNLQPYIADLMAQGGYVLYHRKGLLVYSTLGVGYGAFATHIFNTRKKYPEFVPSSLATRDDAVLIQKGVVGSISIGADYFVGHHDMSHSKGFAIGMRVGYDARPRLDTWQVSQYSIPNGPSYSASGTFIRITIGKGSIGAY